MTHSMTFIYLACQTCQAKIHCDQCGEDVTSSLLQMDGIEKIELNMVAKTISISGSADMDDLECKLEDLGFLLN